MQRLLLFVSFSLALVFCLVSGNLRAEPVKEIAPILDENTFFVAHLDLNKVDLDKIAEHIKAQMEKNSTLIEQNAGENAQILALAPMMLEMFKQQIEENILNPLRDDGKVSDIYLVANLATCVDASAPDADLEDIIRQPPSGFFPFYFAIPAQGKTDEQVKAIYEVFSKSEAFPVRFKRFGFIFLMPGNERVKDDMMELVRTTFTKIDPKPRPELAEAFAALENSDLKAILMRPKGFEKPTYEEIISELIDHMARGWEEYDSAYFGELEIGDPFANEKSLAAMLKQQLSKGIRWTAVGLNLEGPEFQWTFQSEGKDGAKATAALLDKIAETFFYSVIPRDIDPEVAASEKGKIAKSISLFLPKETDNGRLSIKIDQEYVAKNTAEVQNSFDSMKSIALAAKSKQRTPNNLKQIMLAMHNYHDVHNSFPASSTEKANKPMHSWRVALLPFMEQGPLYDNIRHDEPWDSEFNKQFHNRMPEVYITTDQDEKEIEKGLTKIAMIVGPDAVFTGPNKWNGMSTVTDGTSNTIGITERTKAVCWMDPAGDISQESAYKGINKKVDDGIGGTTNGRELGAYAALMDGSVRFLPESLDADVLKAIITRGSGESVAIPEPEAIRRAQPRPPLRPQPRARNNDASTKLKLIGLAMHNFHDARSMLPAASMSIGNNNTQFSWRVHLLPYLEEQALYDEIMAENWESDEAWDSEANKKFHARMPEIFRSEGITDIEAAKGLTRFAVVTGENTPFMEADQKKTFAILTDGTSNTLFVTEKKEPVCWMDPAGDIDVTKIVKGINKDKDGIGGPAKQKGKAGVNVLMFDGSVHFFPEDMDVETLKNTIDPKDGNWVEIP